MARKIKAPTQPLMSKERALFGAVENETDYIELRGKRIGLRDLGGFAKRKISKILLKEGGDEFAVGCKCIAAARLSSYFRIKFLWPILWRWYYYFRNYTDSDLTDAICLIKKKSSLGELLLQYHIADRDEGNDDVDEQGGSRSFPSRTFYGQQWEICKERPWLAEPLRFLGIPITPPFYYLLSMSCRQVELMCADCAVTVYPKTDTVKDGKGMERKFSRPSSRSLDEARKRFDTWDDARNPKVDLSGFSFS